MSAPLPKAAFQDGAVQVATVNPPCMCPHCGYNFERDTGIHLGAWSLWPTTTVYEGRELPLRRSESGVLYALAKAGGQWVTTDALLNRVSDSEHVNVVSTMIASIRKKLGDIAPIDSERGQGSRGYRWVGGRA